MRFSKVRHASANALRLSSSLPSTAAGSGIELTAAARPGSTEALANGALGAVVLATASGGKTNDNVTSPGTESQQVADLRSKDVEQIVGRRLASAYRREESSAASVGAATPAEAK